MKGLACKWRKRRIISFSNQFLVHQMVVDVSRNKYFRGLWIENAIKLSQKLEETQHIQVSSKLDELTARSGACAARYLVSITLCVSIRKRT